MIKLIKENKYFYLLIGLIVVAGAILLVINSRAEVTLWVNEHYNRFFDFYFYNTNYMGEPFFTLAVIGIIGILRNWRLALKAASCFVAVFIVTQFIKLVLFPGELRPTLYFEEYFPHVELRLLDGVVQLKTETFPSGHTSAAFSLMTFFALYWKNKKVNWLLAALALSVGYARIYLSQHFITDVYVGMILGVLITTLVYYYYPKRWLKTP
jgi:Membrane-associated phospholipid phosphatase